MTNNINDSVNNEDFENLEIESIPTNVDDPQSGLTANISNNNSQCDDIEIILARENPQVLIDYKKNISKYESLGRIVESHIDREGKKNPERKELSDKLMNILQIQLGIFMMLFFIIFTYLAEKGETQKLIELFKWFMAGTLGEFTAIIFFIVKFLFNNNAEIFKHVKELIMHDNQENKKD